MLLRGLVGSRGGVASLSWNGAGGGRGRRRGFRAVAGFEGSGVWVHVLIPVTTGPCIFTVFSRLGGIFRSYETKNYMNAVYDSSLLFSSSCQIMAQGLAVLQEGLELFNGTVSKAFNNAD